MQGFSIGNIRHLCIICRKGEKERGSLTGIITHLYHYQVKELQQGLFTSIIPVHIAFAKALSKAYHVFSSQLATRIKATADASDLIHATVAICPPQTAPPTFPILPSTTPSSQPPSFSLRLKQAQDIIFAHCRHPTCQHSPAKLITSAMGRMVEAYRPP